MAFQMYVNMERAEIEGKHYALGWNAALDASRLDELLDLTSVIDHEDGRDYLFDNMVQIQEIIKKTLKLYKEVKT
jgi:hypothetical protein